MYTPAEESRGFVRMAVQLMMAFAVPFENMLGKSLHPVQHNARKNHDHLETDTTRGMPRITLSSSASTSSPNPQCLKSRWDSMYMYV